MVVILDFKKVSRQGKTRMEWRYSPFHPKSLATWTIQVRTNSPYAPACLIVGRSQLLKNIHGRFYIELGRTLPGRELSEGVCKLQWHRLGRDKHKCMLTPPTVVHVGIGVCPLKGITAQVKELGGTQAIIFTSWVLPYFPNLLPMDTSNLRISVIQFSQCPWRFPWLVP